MRRDGFTLIEVLAACALLTAALAMIWGTWLAAGETMEALERKTTVTEHTSMALARITRELRHVSLAEVDGLPGPELYYRVPADLDGNGIPVDSDGVPEWGAMRRIGRDQSDANGDGITTAQLVLQHEDRVEVLAGSLVSGERAEGGVWFERRGNAIRVSIRMESKTRRRGLALPAVMIQDVTPRNS